ncbi:MAG TPA: DsrE/DsrF/DrsH-like family protein [bacterium]|jgi:peroxiredoxin family protein|nr:DsrE/DsrF/DrsH-like family protein [bacterium]
MSKTMVESREPGEKVTTGKLSIIMFSGTADKFIPLGVLAQAAAAMEIPVNIFVTGFALLGFTKQLHDLPFPAEFAGMAPALAQGMKASRVQPWDAMLRQAKELGAKVYACSMMADVMGLKLRDFNDLVDDIVGAAAFLGMAEGGQTLFI